MSDHNEEPNGWFETYVQHRFDQLAEQIGEVAAKLDEVRQTVPRIEERVRIQAVMFGVLGGFLPAVGALVYFAIKRGP